MLMSRDLRETGRGYGDLVMGVVPIQTQQRMKDLASAYSSTKELNYCL